jgi:Polysaccharide lyase 14/S-layer homology domain
MARTNRPSRRLRALVLIVAVLVASTGAVVAVPPAPAVAGGTIYIDETFDSTTWDTDGSTWWNWIGGYISRGAIPGILSNGTRITMKKGNHEAAMLHHALPGPDQAYFRYWMRFEDVPEDTGKLPGFMGLYSDSARGNNKPSESQPGWSARVLFGPDGANQVKLGYYTYHLDQGQGSGDGMWWSEKAQLGEWVCVEGRVKMNTPGSPDGQLEAWLNSKQVFNRSNLRFRTASQSGVHIKEFMFEVYYGGSSTAPRDTRVSFDGLVVADTRIGCEIGGSSFTDVQDSPFINDIDWLADQGITKGCNPTANTRFCPTNTVTRGQMAAFLHRALGGLLDVPDAPPPPPDAPQMWGVEVSDYSGAMSTMESATGDPIDMVYVLYNLDKGDWTEQKNYEDPTHNPLSHWVPIQMSNIHNAGSVPYIEFKHNNITGFNNGSYDAQFNGWLDVITGWLDADPSRRVLIAPFPDANNESELYGDSISAFSAAYRKVHDTVRARGIGPDQAAFVYQVSANLDSSRYSFGSIGNGFGAFSPGDAYIDIAAISWNNTGSPSWYDWDSLYGDRVAEMNSEIGGHVPVLLAIIASVPSGPLGQTRAQWYDDLAEGINASASAVGFIYMDKDKGKNYDVDTAGTPEGAFVDFVNDINSPANQLDWVFDGSMATWKAAMKASSASGQFTDDNGSVFEQDIAWLARSGITKGCNPPANTKFCPDSPVTRGQMAAFLHRALGGIIAASGPSLAFTDTNGSTFAADIDWLARTGITRGCNPPANTQYCPDKRVTRGQMAAFLHRALGGL